MQLDQPYSLWLNLLNDPRYSPSSEAIKDYLKLTDGLESPVPYHVWSFISLMSALIGNKITLNHGPLGKVRLNLGIILTGAPALRKSTALSVMQRFAEGLNISYGPTDTAGQRQGLMSAMTLRAQRKPKDENEKNVSIGIGSLLELSETDTDSIDTGIDSLISSRSNELYFVSKELGRLIASTTRELLDFFNDAIDGNDIDYQLKTQKIRINNPLVNLLGATTVSSLGSMMPKGASEHGFLSRLIFVHCDVISKAVPVPTQLGKAEQLIRENLHDRINAIFDQGQTEIGLSEAAIETYVDLYGYTPPLADVRMQAYIGRRPEHVIRVAAILALLRGSGAHSEVIASDVRLAHGILALTERLMDRAYYGLETGPYSKVLCAATELIEGNARGVVTLNLMQSHAGHIADRESITRMMISLADQGKLKHVGHGNSTEWSFNETGREHIDGLMAKAFRLSLDGSITMTPDPDEFRPWSVGARKLGIKKEGA